MVKCNEEGKQIRESLWGQAGRLLLLSQVARGGFSDKVSFEYDMNEKKKPGIQKTQRENAPGEGNSEAQVCQGRSI